MPIWGNKATGHQGFRYSCIQQLRARLAMSVWVEASPVKQKPQAETSGLGSLFHPLQSASTQRVRLIQCKDGPLPKGFHAWVLSLGHMGLGYLQEPASHSIHEVPDSHEETPGPGGTEKGPPALFASFQPGSGVASGPQGAWGHLLLFLRLELLVSLIQVCEHLQQTGSCLSLVSQGSRTGPWEKEKEATGAQRGQGRLL